jgi:hypothetical protein
MDDVRLGNCWDSIDTRPEPPWGKRGVNSPKADNPIEALTNIRIDDTDGGSDAARHVELIMEIVASIDQHN